MIQKRHNPEPPQSPTEAEREPLAIPVTGEQPS